MKTVRAIPNRTLGRRSLSGFVLLDAVIAILVFSIGILGMVALQATAIKLAGDAKYRTDAAMLVDQVIAQMWGSDLKTSGALATAYAGTTVANGGPKYKTWAATLDCTSATAATGCLPGATANPPTISVTGNNVVTITINWQAPNDTGPHNYVSISQLTR